MRLGSVQLVNTHQESIGELLKALTWYSTSIVGERASAAIRAYNDYSKEVIGGRYANAIRVWEQRVGFDRRPHPKVMLVQDPHVGLEDYFELRRKEAEELLRTLAWFSTSSAIGSRASQAIRLYHERIVQVEVM